MEASLTVDNLQALSLVTSQAPIIKREARRRISCHKAERSRPQHFAGEEARCPLAVVGEGLPLTHCEVSHNPYVQMSVLTLSCRLTSWLAVSCNTGSHIAWSLQPK